MEILLQKLYHDSIVPAYATAGAACFDLHARFFDTSFTKVIEVSPGFPQVIPTGIAVEIPVGYAMMLFSRSGHGFKRDTRLANCVGIIDSDYRGEVMVKLTCDNGSLVVAHEERIAQAWVVPVERVNFKVTDTLSETARGTGGLGSTGS